MKRPSTTKKKPIAKNKRRHTRHYQGPLIGDWRKGRVFYPDKIKSETHQSEDYFLRGFSIHTHYLSILDGEKKPFRVHFWAYTNADNLREWISLRVEGVPIFVEKDKAHYNGLNKGWLQLTPGEKKVERVRKIITPLRKTLDNNSFDITLFQRDNYLGIPLCLNCPQKEHPSEGWGYIYNTVIDGVEGLAYSFETDPPVTLREQDNDIIYI